MLLALDTATPACTAALFGTDGAVLAQFDELMARGHAEQLMPLLDRLLDGRRPDAIVVGCGPGSFTGLRVGIAAAHGLAIGWGVPLAGMSTLALIAAGFAGDGPGRGGADRRSWRAVRAAVQPRSASPRGASGEPVSGSRRCRDRRTGGGRLGRRSAYRRSWLRRGGRRPPSAVAALRLPEPLRALPARPVYARAPDAKPKAA
jgi:tRNA threonylcarbamoyladenosine biosynthesis protein TsaB